MSTLVFLKLGGSLITKKDGIAAVRHDALARLAGEIRIALNQTPDLRLVLGHGSGSFGHVPAKKYGTRSGVQTEEQWVGFVEVWRQAAALNHLVMDALRDAGLNAIAFPPSASVSAADGAVAAWNLDPLRAALRHGLLPVVYGDVVFDSERGGTILSTEDVFFHLAHELQPGRILLAGDETGIYSDFPARTQLIAQLTPANFTSYASALGGSAATDVTGGMAGKVQAMLGLLKRVPDCKISVFSGLVEDNVHRALAGEDLGTLLTAA